ncbi:hypothetical protein ABENE_22150 [Asticcacaulis benevestitus DSM 16100 = ATCC BAA-896]|uniref:Uncharacterized protein n=1 Tax=Asticcacaulis benevestitus DSM 16100 = ATCC BAA-896 TaxID=1121022 RepID=V4P809_9CAUL|nr:hypothetical protein ABENE_22150 [Asticcacaulis benevestitus DSM 16100 = ATCC BAA-896]
MYLQTLNHLIRGMTTIGRKGPPLTQTGPLSNITVDNLLLELRRRQFSAWDGTGQVPTGKRQCSRLRKKRNFTLMYLSMVTITS